jgi:hypothetical protein
LEQLDREIEEIRRLMLRSSHETANKENPIVRLVGKQSKAKTVEMLKIFQVWKEIQSSV